MRTRSAAGWVPGCLKKYRRMGREIPARNIYSRALLLLQASHTLQSRAKKYCCSCTQATPCSRGLRVGFPAVLCRPPGASRLHSDSDQEFSQSSRVKLASPLELDNGGMSRKAVISMCNASARKAGGERCGRNFISQAGCALFFLPAWLLNHSQCKKQISGFRIRREPGAMAV